MIDDDAPHFLNQGPLSPLRFELSQVLKKTDDLAGDDHI